MNGRKETGDVRYDYDRQAWVRWDGKTWVIEACSHPSHNPNCYACNNAGERITTGLEKIR